MTGFRCDEIADGGEVAQAPACDNKGSQTTERAATELALGQGRKHPSLWPIGLNAYCTGAFIVDHNGIHSDGPVMVKTRWDEASRTLFIEDDLQFSCEVMVGGIVVAKLTEGMGSRNPKSRLVVGGVELETEELAALAAKKKQKSGQAADGVFSKSWKALVPRENSYQEVVIRDVNVAAKANVKIQVPLGKNCSCHVTGKLAIRGDNSETSLTVTNTGPGSLTLNGMLRALTAKITGQGKVLNPWVLKCLNVVLEGPGELIATCHSCCAIKYSVTGNGRVAIERIGGPL